jgi:hypothetical protein
LVGTAACSSIALRCLSDLDPDKLTPEMLDKIAEHLITKALGTNRPGLMAEVERRIEAGEEVTLETFAEDVTAGRPPRN